MRLTCRSPFASTFVGQWQFNDFVYFDGIAYFSMLLAIWVRSPEIAALCLGYGGLVDESVILALPLIYLCHFLRMHSVQKATFQSLAKPEVRLQLGFLFA